jgi:hypothetical protein
MESMDDVINELNKKIKSEYDSFFDSFSSELFTKIQDLPIRAELNGDNIKIVTFGEMYPQLSEYDK